MGSSRVERVKGSCIPHSVLYTRSESEFAGKPWLRDVRGEHQANESPVTAVGTELRADRQTALTELTTLPKNLRRLAKVYLICTRIHTGLDIGSWLCMLYKTHVYDTGTSKLTP